MKKLSIIIITFTIVQLSLAQDGWNMQNPGTSSPLRDVCFVDQNTGWIVAHQNTILKTTDGGQNWFEQTPPLVPFYYAVYFINDQTGWVLGEYETIAHTTDGGDTWATQSTPGHNPSDIYFINADTGWIAGGRDQGFPGPDPLREILHTEDGGNTWAIQYQEDFEFPLDAIHFADAQTGCAVGNGGAIMFTLDGGENWSQQTSTVNTHLEGVYMKSSNEGWIVGIDGVILHTTDAGSNWMEVSSGTSNSLSDIVFANEKGWICGGSNDEATILHNDGISGTWNMQDPGTTNYLSGISFVDEQYGWAVGFNGTIVHTTTGGNPPVGIQPFKEYGDKTNISSYPNPFKNQTTVNYLVSKDTYVRLELFDINGKLIEVMFNEFRQKGNQTYLLNGSELVPGVYYLILSTDLSKQTRKILKL